MKALFIDRDGVILKEKNYVYRQEDAEFLPGVFEALKKATASGYRIIIVSNQSGIARGLYTEKDYLKLEKWLETKFEENSVKIDGVYYCPHHPEASVKKYKKDCECRKPKPGMILKAAKEHNLNLAESFMIGDKTTDVEAGKNAGCKTILVKTGYAGKDSESKLKPDFVADDLLSAVEIILGIK